MKKQSLIFVFALTCVLSLSAGVEAQARRELRVNVPFDFIAAGKTMPAGTYTVSRVSQSGLSGLQLSNYDGNATVVVLPVEFVSGDATTAVRVGFERVGDIRFLKKVVTDTGTYNLSTERSVAALARVRQQQEMSSSGAQ